MNSPFKLNLSKFSEIYVYYYTQIDQNKFVILSGITRSLIWLEAVNLVKFIGECQKVPVKCI